MHRLVQVRSEVRRSEYVRVKLWFLKKNIWKCSKTKLKEWGHSLRFPMNWFGTSYFYFQIFSMSELISFFFFMFFLFLFGDKNAALKIVTDVTAPHNWKKLDEVCNCLNFLICFHLCCSSFLNDSLFFFCLFSFDLVTFGAMSVTLMFQRPPFLQQTRTVWTPNNDFLVLDQVIMSREEAHSPKCDIKSVLSPYPLVLPYPLPRYTGACPDKGPAVPELQVFFTLWIMVLTAHNKNSQRNNSVAFYAN